MKNTVNRSASLLVCVAIALSACASPKVVERVRIGDDALSCPEIQQQIEQTKKLREEALSNRGFTVTNTMAVLFFWPALFVTDANVKTAVDAADKREENLMTLYRAKNCAETPAALQSNNNLHMNSDVTTTVSATQGRKSSSITAKGGNPVIVSHVAPSRPGHPNSASTSTVSTPTNVVR